MNTLKFPNFSCQKRDDFVSILRQKDIEASVHFTPPVHLQPAYYDTFNHLNLPVTDKVSNTIVTLPIYPNMSSHDSDEVCQIINKEYQKIK